MAGADLRSMGDDDRDAWPAAWVTDQGVVAREALWAVYDCAVPVIAAVNGAAIGAGLAFAAVCDMILAAEGGAVRDHRDQRRPARRERAPVAAWPARTRSGRCTSPVSSWTRPSSTGFGAVQEVVPLDEFMRGRASSPRCWPTKSPIAMRLAKEALNRVEFLPLKDAYRVEQDYTRRLATYEDAEEARHAFVEKRAPEWRWR